MCSIKPIPEEFEKVIEDFVCDIKLSFPEYDIFISKWWKSRETFSDEAKFREHQEKRMRFIFQYCLKKYPPHFFDILHKNNELFSEDSVANTEFLPQIHFKNVWEDKGLSEKTKETIWKYLQLILFSIIGSVDNRDAFGESSQIFDSLNNDEFKDKLQTSLNDIQELFAKNAKEEEEDKDKEEKEEKGQSRTEFKPNAENIQSHLKDILDSKLGQMAKEIAEDVSRDFNMDLENVSSQQEVFAKLFQNPTKLMGMVKNVSEKIENKIKSGDMKESELLNEASNLIGKMKDIPGLDQMLSKMGLGGNGTKLNVSAMQDQINQKIKMEKTKERMRSNVQQKKREKQEQEEVVLETTNTNNTLPAMSEQEMLDFIGVNDSTETKPSKKQKKVKGKK